MGLDMTMFVGYMLLCLLGGSGVVLGSWGGGSPWLSGLVGCPS